MGQDNFGLKGNFRIENVSTGQVIEQSNTIHNVGFSTITGMMGSGLGLPNQFGWLALGIGSDTISASDMTLGSEYLKRFADDVSQATTSVTNDTLRLIGSFTADDTKTINEVGIFNQSGLDLGSMLARSVFANINASSGDKINATYDVQAS